MHERYRPAFTDAVRIDAITTLYKDASEFRHRGLTAETSDIIRRADRVAELLAIARERKTNSAKKQPLL